MMDQTTQTAADKNIGFGQRLKAIRESLNLTEKDAAARLHLSYRIVNLIESEDYSDAPPTIFMKGYLRSYARLLNVTDDEINKALDKLGLNNVESTSIPHMPLMQNGLIRETNSRYTAWMTYLVIAISIVLVGVWWNTHSLTPTAVPVTPAAENTTPVATEESTTTATETAPNNMLTNIPTPTVPTNIPSDPITTNINPQIPTPNLLQPAPVTTDPLTTKPTIDSSSNDATSSAGLDDLDMDTASASDTESTDIAATETSDGTELAKKSPRSSEMHMALPNEPGLESGY